MKFKVTLRRTSYAYATLEVEAPNGREAIVLARQQEGDLTYSERDADYEVDGVEKIEGDLPYGQMFQGSPEDGWIDQVIGKGTDDHGDFLVLRTVSPNNAHGCQIHYRSHFVPARWPEFDRYMADDRIPWWGPEPLHR